MNTWDKAAEQAERELGAGASLYALEARAEQILVEMNAPVEIDSYPMSPRMQHSEGKTITDWREVGRRMMLSVGHDPDKPLDIDWDNLEPDRRDMRDPEELGKEILATRGYGEWCIAEGI